LADFIEVDFSLDFEFGKNLKDSRLFTGDRTQEGGPKLLNFVRVIQRVDAVKTIRTGIELE
jgi:hypothetical protein